MNEASLDGRRALVTGGGRGIGAAIARDLVARGARVVIADSGTGIDGEGADPSVAGDLAASLGDAARPFSESIASPGAAAAAVDLAVREFGGIDLVVNNAAILRDAFIFRGDPGNWEAVLRNNLSAACYILLAATPVMREQAKAAAGDEAARGRIVSIVSTAGLYGNFGQHAYGAAKAGLVGLTRVAALDLARDRITANSVAPFAHTRVTDIIQPANDEQASYKERAMKVDAGHVARLVSWLCGPDAADVSGQLFGVRGREVFLFSQPRPVARIASETADWTPETLTGAIRAGLAPDYTSLESDLEAFNTEPLV